MTCIRTSFLEEDWQLKRLVRVDWRKNQDIRVYSLCQKLLRSYSCTVVFCKFVWYVVFYYFSFNPSCCCYLHLEGRTMDWAVFPSFHSLGLTLPMWDPDVRFLLFQLFQLGSFLHVVSLFSPRSIIINCYWYLLEAF